MSYVRVIPRDLFNEANLLKCLGRIYINLETAGLDNVELEHDGDAFDVQMDESSGALYLANVTLMVRGEPIGLERPMNSRDSWPLMAATDDDLVPVFNADGSFSEEMMTLLRGQAETEKAKA